jgi:probable DNA repair protein
MTDLLDRLERGEQLLLPSAHAAALLRAEYNARQQALDRRGWMPAAVTPWSQWLTAQWNSLVARGDEERILLNSSQERALWQEIVQQQREPSSLASPTALAQLAQNAWNLAASYGALAKLRSTAHTLDSRTFAQWAEAFQARCRMQQCLPPALLPQSLLEHLESGTWTPPQTITRVGFFEDAPATLTLLDRLVTRGCIVETVPLEMALPSSTAPDCYVLPTPRDELIFAARWAREQLSSSRADGSLPRIGLLIPSLTEERDELASVLREVFAPELQSLDDAQRPALWHSTQGPALLLQPMLQNALHLLRWTTRALPTDAVTALLLSPYFAQNATENERDANARWDAQTLRQVLQLHDSFTLEQTLRLATQKRSGSQPIDGPDPHAQPSLFENLQALHAATQPPQLLTRDRSHGEWMEFARSLLRIMGWPGARVLEADEQALTAAWESALDTVATLDFQGRRVRFAHALDQLESQLRSTKLATAPLAPVQIMSPDEAEGICFDAALLLRATDAQWPVAIRVHPLLSWSLQRSFQMPGTDPTITLPRAVSQAERLMQRSNRLYLTRAAEDADGPLRASGVLRALGLVEQEIQVERNAIALPLVPLLSVAESSGLPSLPAAQVQGGSSVLKLQSACGFHAYAALRLRARSLNTLSTGLDASETGNLVHRALQLVWGELGTLDDLQQRHAAGTLEAVVRQCIERAIPRQLGAESAWDDAYLSTVQQRVCQLMLDWLDLEMRRPDFTVLEREEKQLLSIGPLELSVRMDRIDKVGDGFLLIDYKTGESGKVKDWDGARPRDPQLPLYALLYEPHELQGLAFAKVRSGDRLCWDALLTDATLLPGRQMQVDLEAQQHTWRVHLTQLAEQFAAGHATVDPRDPFDDCVHCEHRLLCRIDSTDAMRRASAQDDLQPGEDGTHG